MVEEFDQLTLKSVSCSPRPMYLRTPDTTSTRTRYASNLIKEQLRSPGSQLTSLSQIRVGKFRARTSKVRQPPDRCQPESFTLHSLQREMWWAPVRTGDHRRKEQPRPTFRARHPQTKVTLVCSVQKKSSLDEAAGASLPISGSVCCPAVSLTSGRTRPPVFQAVVGNPSAETRFPTGATFFTTTCSTSLSHPPNRPPCSADCSTTFACS